MVCNRTLTMLVLQDPEPYVSHSPVRVPKLPTLAPRFKQILHTQGAALCVRVPLLLPNKVQLSLHTSQKGVQGKALGWSGPLFG